jgi:lipoprotein-anchoring transpeptidase ErfK/SrfK
MSKKSLIIPAVVLVLALIAAGGVLAYDGSRPERLAKGIVIGGIDVGGLAPAAARARLDEELVGQLERPVVVHHGSKRWTLTAREAKVRTTVDEVVDDAVARSEKGGVLGRSMRRISGNRVEVELQPDVTFSDRAVVRLVDRVRRAVGRPAEDAKMRISAAGVEAEPGRRGLQVRASALHESINAALISPTAKRRFAAKTRKVKPKVTAAALAKKNPVVLIADRGANTLRVYKDLKLVKTYGIAAGSPQYPTPAGEFTIANKVIDPAWSVPNSDWAGSLAGEVIPGGAPDNPLKARWMGIIDGVGIHGTSSEGSIGSNASHGCLRMRVSDVIDLYPQVPVGAKILIS